MFKVGDIVEVKLPDFPVGSKSAVYNLEGTIAEIREIVPHIYHDKLVYHLKFIDLKIKDKTIFYPDQSDYSWLERNLKYAELEKEFKDMDVISILKGK